LFFKNFTIFDLTSCPKFDVPNIMHLLKSTTLAMLVLCVALVSCSKDDTIEQFENKFEIDLELVYKNDSQMSGRILNLINAHRDSLGLSTLIADTRYASAYAVKHTDYMISQQRISHDNFGHRSEAIKYHDNATVVGENVAFGFDSAEKTVQAWLQSPGHKKIIEGDYTHTGFGIVKDESGENYFTQIFYRK